MAGDNGPQVSNFATSSAPYISGASSYYSSTEKVLWLYGGIYGTLLLFFSFFLLFFSILIDAYTANGTRSKDMYQFVVASSTWHIVSPNTSLHTRSPAYPPVLNTSLVPPSPGTLRSPSLQAINDDLFVVGGQSLSADTNDSMWPFAPLSLPLCSSSLPLSIVHPSPPLSCFLFTKDLFLSLQCNQPNGFLMLRTQERSGAFEDLLTPPILHSLFRWQNILHGSLVSFCISLVEFHKV